MRTFTLKGLFLTTVFMLLGCLAIHAADDGLITEQVVVKLDEAGTLPDKISESDKYRITNLKIIGEINGTDLRLIREMAGWDVEGNNTSGKLAILNLSEVQIVKGGDYYLAFKDWDENGEFLRAFYSSNNVIGDYVFYRCSNLSNITLPSSLTSIGDAAFGYCDGLTSITLPSSLTSIGDETFKYCNSLTSITLPSSITSMGKYVFRACSGLKSAIISSGVTVISEGAFRDCSSLTSITIPKSVKWICDWAFMGCSGLTSIAIPNSVTSIGNGVFANCSSLTSVNIPFKNSYYIAYGVFANCSSLTSIAIPETVFMIYRTAFENCISLTSITIPSSVVEIQEYAFEGCLGLKSVYVNWEKPLEIETSIFKNIDAKACILYVPRGTLDAYKNSAWGDIFENIVEYDATGVANITTSGDAQETSRYSVNGQRLDAPTKGLNIVKYSDGSVKKVIIQ